jgi:conjugative transfer signal peptidase TraF
MLTKPTTNGSSDEPVHATGRLRERVRRALIRVFVFASIFCALVALCAILGIRFNLTESLPGFLYIVTSDDSSPLVDFCPEGTFAQLSKERGYRRRGICPDGAAPILKPIVAKAGDIVEVSSNGITVNGSLLRNTSPRTTDSRGRPLTHWPFGRYDVPPGFVWVASEYNPLSFDSRYYGPIQISHIRHHLRRL